MAKATHKTSPFVIGLVGGIASGKTYVAKTLESLGASRIDADQLAHAVLARPLIARRLGQVFGEQILDAEGAVDRRQLGELVFGDEPTSDAARKQLEEIVHPLIHAAAVHELRKLREASQPPTAVVIDAPLLLEAGWAPMCDAIIFIDTPDAQRMQRAIARGWSGLQFRHREAAQMPLDEKRQQATHFVLGTEDAPALKRILRQILEEIEA